MNNEIIALTRNENFIVLSSVGINVRIFNTIEELNENIKEVASGNFKIILYDIEGEPIVNELIDKYDEMAYPIFLKLPTSEAESSLEGLRDLIAKSIGISVI